MKVLVNSLIVVCAIISVFLLYFEMKNGLLWNPTFCLLGVAFSMMLLILKLFLNMILTQLSYFGVLSNGFIGRY